MNTNDLLIIGKVPPPIGGVTVHVKRLLDKLNLIDYPFSFKILNKKRLWLDLISIRNYKKFHLHTSNVYLQFIFALLSKVTKTKSIITFHGDLDRYKGLRSGVVVATIKITDYPIVLNQKSKIKADKINKKSLLISAFIPPGNEDPLPDDLLQKLNKLKSKCKKVFGTNAHDVSFDKENNEIYGISDLIVFFNSNPDFGLIVSDPKGKYHQFLKKKGLPINDNIIIVDYKHSFYEVLKQIDGSIRNTSTDGDSLSVKESLFLNKLTFVSDVVSRPKGVIKFKRGNYEGFLKDYELNKYDVSSFDGSEKLIQLYKTI